MAHTMKLICLMVVVILMVTNNRCLAAPSEMEDSSEALEDNYNMRELDDMLVDKRMIGSCSIYPYSSIEFIKFN